MTIAVDASRAVTPQPTGTELYSTRLIQYLAKIDQVNQYVLYSPVKPSTSLESLPANFSWKIIPFPRLWSHLRFSWSLFVDQPSLVLIPSHVIPLYCPGKIITTVHDIAYEVFPNAYSPFNRWYLKFSTLRAVKKASIILTPSHQTKNDLIRLYGAAESKIKVTPLGFDHPSTTNANDQKFRHLKPYFLMISRLETKKNIILAINAFANLKQLQPENKVKLLLGGKPGFGYREIKLTIERLPTKIQNDIVELGYIEPAAAASAMADAAAFLYPSHYEGFGLPLLEAMASSTPVIAADSSSIPEVVGDAAILIDPNSENELTDAMKIILTNDLTANQLRQKGKQRVKLFSWEKMAHQTLEIINEQLKKKGS